MFDTTEGQRFSHVYLRGADLLPDSQRMRNRLAHLIADSGDGEFRKRVGSLLEKEHGISLGISNPYYASSWPDIVKRLELRDVLDIVTTTYRAISHHDVSLQSGLREKFVSHCRRIFLEEEMRYRVDALGGVHFSVDVAFEETRASTILSVSSSRYNAVRALYEEAFVNLDKTPPDGKGALRSAFFATEALFRLMFPNSHQLSSSEVGKYLEPLVNRVYSGQKPAINLAQKLVSSFRDWIDGAHFYRHEPGTEDPAQPPLELAIYMLSEAGGHIRWLAKLDAINRDG